jgi:CHAD domain-containing protein
MLEREVKLEAPPSFRLETIARLGGGYRVSKITTAVFDSRYFDTTDRRLARAGCSLRYRTGDRWTLKLPDVSERGEFARAEHTVIAGPRTPPAALVDLATAYARTRRLRAVATLHTERRTVTLASAGGAALAEVADDRVSAHLATGAAMEFRELEVELAPHGSSSVLFDVVRRLQALGGGAQVFESKIHRVLGASGPLTPELRSPHLSAHSSVADLLRAELTVQTATLVANDAGIRLGLGPEPLHLTRVAARRIRSALRVFRPLLDRAWSNRLRADLEWLGNVLGAARDADVLVQRLRARAATLDGPLAPQRARLIAALHEGSDAKYKSVRRALKAPRYARLLERLVLAAAHPRLTRDGTVAARDAAPELIAKPWRDLKSAVKKTKRRPTDAELHRLRIRVRRVRYVAEAAAHVLGPDMIRFARRLTRLQDILGEQHDAAVAAAYVKRVGSRTRASQVATALLEAEGRVDERRRAEWRKSWAKVVNVHRKLM